MVHAACTAWHIACLGDYQISQTLSLLMPLRQPVCVTKPGEEAWALTSPVDADVSLAFVQQRCAAHRAAAVHLHTGNKIIL